MAHQHEGILHKILFESNIVNLFFSCTDLKTMSERLKNRYYVSKKLFMADLQRVFTNCREYNPPESEYYKCANILEKFFYTKIKEAGLIDKWHFFFLNNQTNQCAYFMGRGSHYISELWDYKVLKNFCLTISTFKNHFSFANMYYNEVTKIILLKCFIMYLITDFFVFPLPCVHRYLPSLRKTTKYGKLRLFGIMKKIPRQWML